MSDELVSVIVPTYNRAYCLARAVDSALAQSHHNVEVLIIDDGSTDNTRGLVSTLYESEPRVRYIPQPNQGVSGARNTGIRRSRGEYVALLDSDDLWHPWKLEVQLAVLRRLPEVGMVSTELEAIDPAGKVINTRFLKTMYPTFRQFTDEELFSSHYPLSEFAPEGGDVARDATVHVGQIFSQMIMGGLVHTSTVVIRRERLEKVGFFDLGMRAGEDYDFHLRTSREGPVAFIDVASIQYQRGFDDHLSDEKNKLHVALNFLKTITPYLVRDRSRIQLSDRKIRDLLASTHRWIAEKALNTGKRELAREHFRQSLRFNWRQSRDIGLYLLTCLPESLEHLLRETYRRCKLQFHRRPLEIG